MEQNPSVEVERIKTKGNNEFKAGNFDKAVVYYTQAISISITYLFRNLTKRITLLKQSCESLASF